MTKIGQGKNGWFVVFCCAKKKDGTRCNRPVRNEGSNCSFHKNKEGVF